MDKKIIGIGDVTNIRLSLKLTKARVTKSNNKEYIGKDLVLIFKDNSGGRREVELCTLSGESLKNVADCLRYIADEMESDTELEPNEESNNTDEDGKEKE